MPARNFNMRFFSLILSIIYFICANLGINYGKNDIIFAKKLFFNVECRTDIFVSPDEVWDNGAEYPTVISLSHNGTENGTLLATFEVFDKGKTCFRIMESRDKGESWKQISTVYEMFDENLQAAWEPCLFELPEKIGSFREGTIILGEISLDDGCRSATKLCIFASDDCGKTWEEISVADSAGGLDEGIWEPYFVYDGGYLYCFYSDDSDEIHSQTIVYKRTSDLINWSEKVPVVVSDDPFDRPGMPIITRMGNGKYYLCYEIGGNDNYPCRYKVSDSISEWDPSDFGTEIRTKTDRELHASPNCIWLPHGGENGILIIAAKYQNKGNEELFISFDFGETYSLTANPFTYSQKRGFGYSPSFFYDESDETLYYANTIDYKGDRSKVAISRITMH